MIEQIKTNAVKFGRYGIILNKEQLFYYVDGDLVRVTDVSHEFNPNDLMDLALRIAAKKDASKVSFVHRNDIVNVK